MHNSFVCFNVQSYFYHRGDVCGGTYTQAGWLGPPQSSPYTGVYMVHILHSKACHLL